MRKRKYYAITTSMLFEKTVLVPVDSVRDAEDAIEVVDNAVENFTIELLNEDADCWTGFSKVLADENGIYEATDKEVSCLQIIEGDGNEDDDFDYCSDILGWG